MEKIFCLFLVRSEATKQSPSRCAPRAGLLPTTLRRTRNDSEKGLAHRFTRSPCPAGAIDAEATDKAARLVQLCDTHGLPLISLGDTPAFMVASEAETSALVHRVCRMFVNRANLSVPRFVVVPGEGYGVSAQATAGGSYSALRFTVSWPPGAFGGMGLGGDGASRLPQ